jgi:hypothetical protein
MDESHANTEKILIVVTSNNSTGSFIVLHQIINLTRQIWGGRAVVMVALYTDGLLTMDKRALRREFLPGEQDDMELEMALITRNSTYPDFLETSWLMKNILERKKSFSIIGYFHAYIREDCVGSEYLDFLSKWKSVLVRAEKYFPYCAIQLTEKQKTQSGWGIFENNKAVAYINSRESISRHLRNLENPYLCEQNPSLFEPTSEKISLVDCSDVLDR